MAVSAKYWLDVGDVEWDKKPQTNKQTNKQTILVINNFTSIYVIAIPFICIFF